jgi:hypothetical protein
MGFARGSDERRFDWKWEEVNYNRIAAVNLLLSKKNNPTYLEIGSTPASPAQSSIRDMHRGGPPSLSASEHSG